VLAGTVIYITLVIGITSMSMYYWSPSRLKDLKERGYKLRFMSLEEANAQAEGNKPTSAQAQADKHPSHKPKGSGASLPLQD
tara:strand:- start:422 stop:667 length:246 start_codon:yes stop_codon:yes gene_type:complete